MPRPIADRYRVAMTQQTSANRLAVGWCHQCGTIQLKDDMPREWVEWAEAVEPVCVNDDGEPWGLGVWSKGEHLPDCPSVTAARERVVDWSPTLEGCGCLAAEVEPDGEDEDA